jgi:hypothetical protein
MAHVPPPVIGRVQTRVWQLEMRARPARPRVQPPHPDVQVVEARRITTSFYRHLYDTVGAPWCWTGRRLIDDETLRRRIHARGVEIHVLWVAGVPAGYVELDASDPEEAFIA